MQLFPHGGVNLPASYAKSQVYHIAQLIALNVYLKSVGSMDVRKLVGGSIYSTR